MGLLGLSLLSFFVVVGAVSLFYARHDPLAFVEIAHGYSIVVALWLLITQHYMCKMSILHDMFKVIDADVFQYSTVSGIDEDDKARQSVKTLFEDVFQRGFQYIISIGTVLLCVAPVIIRMYASEDRKKIKQLNYDLPVPFWIPFNTDTKHGFLIAYILVCTLILQVAVYLLAAIPFLVYNVLALRLQYDILQNSIINVESRAFERYGLVRGLNGNLKPEMIHGDFLYERCVRECLKENILHHITIVRYFNLYKSFTSSIYGVLIGLSLIILASLSVVLIKTKLFSFETVKFAFFFIVELVIVFGYCFLGSYITEASDKIPNAIYNTSWINLPTSQRKTLLIFQNRVKRSEKLKGSGLFEINLKLFVQIVRTTYSIFNIFSSMH
ncbi:odorant receptor 85a-like [Nilaparvata lugens]|uniref:odorant receptor 85a-like n=1 Tax=Nilaparvata lugens TaxID=108931 RepID=UPI00193CC8A6|nr:odorant receptor 85a-like [Nilaparvata lugens]